MKESILIYQVKNLLIHSADHDVLARRIPTAALAMIVILATLLYSSNGEDLNTWQIDEGDTLILGFTRTVFTDVHIPDALAAMKVWATELKRKRGLSGPVETKVFDDVSSAAAAVEGRLIDLIILTTSEYLSIQCKPRLEPHFVHIKAGKVTEDTLLLVHRQSGINDLDKLESKNILLLNNARTNIGRVWLEALVLKRAFKNLGISSAKSKSSRNPRKPSCRFFSNKKMPASFIEADSK